MGSVEVNTWVAGERRSLRRRGCASDDVPWSRDLVMECREAVLCEASSPAGVVSSSGRQAQEKLGGRKGRKKCLNRFVSITECGEVNLRARARARVRACVCVCVCVDNDGN